MVPYQYEYPEESWGEHGEATMLDEDQVPSSGQANSRHAADSHLDSTPSPAWPHRWSPAPVKHGRGSGKTLIILLSVFKDLKVLINLQPLFSKKRINLKDI